MNINNARNFYSGFYMDAPVGNNQFSYSERNHQYIYVPPLIQGSLNDVVPGDEIVFCEVNEGIEQKKSGLRQFVYTQINQTEIFVFDNHNHAFFFWMLAYQQGVFHESSALVHVDQHTDMREPSSYFSPENLNQFDLKAVFHYTNEILNVGNFIKPALQLGLFSGIQIVDSSTAFQQDHAGEIVLDIDLDIFSDDMAYIQETLKMKKIRELVQQAKLITIATSPYFMDQLHAIQILKKIFEN